jgi:predicted RecB family nuclease
LQILNGKPLLSATDLMRFQGCKHAITLDLLHLEGKGPTKKQNDPEAQILQRLGDEHERNHLTTLKASGKSVCEIERGGKTLSQALNETKKALAQGSDIIFQAALLQGMWGGWSDFLVKVEKPSILGAYSYEVADTKLKRSAHPKHILQLVLYSDLLAELQGVAPECASIELGSKKSWRFRLSDYANYARELRDRLEEFIKIRPPTTPVPCNDCSLCPWSEHCEGIWEQEDSLYTIANISKSQVKKLESIGITTLETLATTDTLFPNLAGATFDRLKTQAQLQQARKSGPPSFQLRDLEAGRGFGRLPHPVEGDIFYDIEGDPHYEEGLEYLHGVYATDIGFISFWAHNHDEEKRALLNLFEFFRRRLENFPHARIYHYAPYETTALKRLTEKYGVGEFFLDRLRREQRFVDLYAVVRGGLIASERNYSIKSLEAFYSIERKGEVKTAGGSVIAYEQWRSTGDQQILDEIAEYNKLDCISTQKLRDFLIQIRPTIPWPAPPTDASEKEEIENNEELELKKQLDAAPLTDERRNLLLALGLFHTREIKPGFRNVFEALVRPDDELLADLECIYGLEATGPARPVKQSMEREYRYPPQETKIRPKQRPSIATDTTFTDIEVTSIDRVNRRITLKIGTKRSELLRDRLNIYPSSPFDMKVIAQAVRAVITDQCGKRALRAIDDFLGRCPPRLKNKLPGPILMEGDLVSNITDIIRNLDSSVIAIQGPPGTGKTYVASRAIAALVRDGRRVAVSSNSHAAIHNVLSAVSNILLEDGGTLVPIAHKAGEGDFNDGEQSGYGITIITSNDDGLLKTAPIVGGTAWLLSRDDQSNAFDYLFVDEAGQVGLANLVAISRCARNLVLIGDPRQLPQVIQGAHPGSAGLSALEYLLGEDATIPNDRGIFLPETRRMHSSLCHFISEQIYEGRLKSHSDTKKQSVSARNWPSVGAYYVPVQHEGNMQISHEEIEKIKSCISDLLTGIWTDKSGTTRPLSEKDVIVVAPFNAQVIALQDALPNGIRVGTVDKFQGQEAPVCLVSMTASSAEESSRGLEFLLSLNRLNVAISRAKALSLVFGAPKLRETSCSSVEQMRLVNTLCALPLLKSL